MSIKAVSTTCTHQLPMLVNPQLANDTENGTMTHISVDFEITPEFNQVAWTIEPTWTSSVSDRRFGCRYIKSPLEAIDHCATSLGAFFPGRLRTEWEACARDMLQEVWDKAAHEEIEEGDEEDDDE